MHLTGDQPGQGLTDNVEELVSVQGAEVVRQATRSRGRSRFGRRASVLGLCLCSRCNGRAGGSGRRSSRRSGSSRAGAARRRASGGSTGVQGRSGDVIRVEGLVNVDEDARVVLAVELGTQSTLGGGISTTGDLQVETLGVALSAILVTGRVQSNDLVAQDIVSGSNIAGDGDGPAVVVGDQVVSGPGAGSFTAINETLLVDFEELQGGLVDLGAVTIAVSHVGDDRTMVTLRPFRPLQLNLFASTDLSRDGTGFGALGANDVRVGVVIDEAQVSGLSGPSDGVRGVVGVSIGGDNVSPVVLTIHDGARDITVTSDQSGRAEKKAGDLGNRHCCKVFWLR